MRIFTLLVVVGLSVPTFAAVETIVKNGVSVLWCSKSKPLGAPAASNLGQSVALLVLDQAFQHGDSVKLTPQFRTCAASWKKSGLLSHMSENILWLQGLSDAMCTTAADWMQHEKMSFTIIGSASDVGIGEALQRMARVVSSDVLLFLERDFAVTPELLPRNVSDTLQVATQFLQQLPGQMGAELILLRHLEGMGRPRGYGGLSRVCNSDEKTMMAAFIDDADTQGNFQMSLCLQNTFLYRFITAVAGTDLCTWKFVEKSNGKVAQCNQDPDVFCYSSRISHWTNNPWMARRDWVISEVFPLIKPCKDDDTKCKYVGIERDQNLQCTLRGKAYTVAQTSGLFGHLVPNWQHVQVCDQGDGYVIPPEEAQKFGIRNGPGCRGWGVPSGGRTSGLG